METIEDIKRDKYGNLVDEKNGIVCVNRSYFSRLLYSNPVCLLSTPTNVMTISWLTPLDNHGHFILSMNKQRYTASLLLAEFQVKKVAHFVLNIPTSLMANNVLSAGASHGGVGIDKWTATGLTRCALNWETWDDSVKELVPSILECVGHIECLLDRVDDSWCEGHLLLGCTIANAMVRSSHWSGTQFFAQQTTASPHLSFLGGQKFAVVRALEGFDSIFDSNK